MSDEVEVLISKEEVEKKIDSLAKQINEDYKDKDLHLICILKGSVYFATALSQRLEMPVTLDFVSVSSYGNQMSGGKLVVKSGLNEDIKDRHCLVIEDIIDSGNTLAMLKTKLEQKKPASLKICTLLDKPARREVAVDVDYVGFSIEDKFVVGWGMDYAQKHRNLPYIGFIKQ
jgi:hypoxanthine phosphoribosyltransferase